MKKTKRMVCYIVFYRFLGGTPEIKKAIVKAEREKIDKEKAIKVFKEQFIKRYPDKKDTLLILGARVNSLEVKKGAN